MFIEREASTKSLAQRSTTLGIGVNDATYETQNLIDGKRCICPYYARWWSMLSRCYSSRVQKIQPTYRGTSVCEEWLTFSKFKSWMETQDWKGKQLDKDLLQPGNKLYSPETCAFISRALNALLNSGKAHRGKHPIGVHFRRDSDCYMARINIEGKSVQVGRYATAAEASAAYNMYKYTHIMNIASTQKDERISNGLRLHAQLYREGRVQ